MHKYEVTRVGNVITFTREHGESYGGERATRIDTEGNTGKNLYNHIRKNAGLAFAKAARNQGFC